MSETSILSTFRRLVKEGQAAFARDLLRDALRRNLLDAESVQRAGRLLAELSTRAGDAPIRVLMAGQVTTSWLSMALTASAWALGIPVLISEGGYDDVLQSLTAPATRPDVVVLVPSSERLLDTAAGSLRERI